MEKSAVTDANYHHNPCPFLLGKTLVVSGQGLAMICAVGSHTVSGKAEEKLNIEEEITPLQAKLETIANEIGKIGVYVAIITFLAMTIKMVVVTLQSDTKVLMSIDSLN